MLGCRDNKEIHMRLIIGLAAALLAVSAQAACPWDPACLNNPHGAGNPYKADGLNNPHSQYGNRFSNKSPNNPYATDAPKLYDSQGDYRGRLSSNQFDPDSTSNPHGQYGNRFSPDSVNNPFGAGNPYNNSPIYVVPQ